MFILNLIKNIIRTILLFGAIYSGAVAANNGIINMCCSMFRICDN